SRISRWCFNSFYFESVFRTWPLDPFSDVCLGGHWGNRWSPVDKNNARKTYMDDCDDGAFRWSFLFVIDGFLDCIIDCGVFNIPLYLTAVGFSLPFMTV